MSAKELVERLELDSLNIVSGKSHTLPGWEHVTQMSSSQTTFQYLLKNLRAKDSISSEITCPNLFILRRQILIVGA